MIESPSDAHVRTLTTLSDAVQQARLELYMAIREAEAWTGLHWTQLRSVIAKLRRKEDLR